MSQQHLLIVEDDPFHLKFLEDQLSSDPFSDLIIHAARSGEEALDWLATNRADFAVVDLQLSGKSGIDVARRLWHASPESSIVFWSNFSDAAYVRAIAKIVPADGNFGYLLKTAAPDKLLRSLLGVFFDRQRVVDSEVQGLIKRQNTRRTPLTTVEVELLNLVALGLTDKAISDMTGMSSRSVQSMITTVYDKIVSEDDSADIDPKHLNRRCHLIGLALMRGELNKASLIDSQGSIAGRFASEKI